MYYRVASFKKNDDFREMIVRVSSKEEAKKQLPAAKEFLFPGEDTTDYWCQIFPVPIKVNLGTTIPHYRIRVTRPAKAEKTPEDWEDIDRGYDAITQAESAEQAKEKGRQMLVEDGEDPDAYEVYVDEMTVEECIREEERSLHRTITNAYLQQPTSTQNNCEAGSLERIRLSQPAICGQQRRIYVQSLPDERSCDEGKM